MVQAETLTVDRGGWMRVVNGEVIGPAIPELHIAPEHPELV